MMKRVLYVAAAALMLVACNSGKETKVVAKWSENAPEKVKIIVGDSKDNSFEVKDGKLEAKVPVDVTVVSRVRAGSAIYRFVSDGSTITLHPEDGTATSNKKKGVHSRLQEYNKWVKDFIADFNEKTEAFKDDEDAVLKYYDEVVGDFNDYQRKIIKANKNNILGVEAIKQIDEQDPQKMLKLVESLSSEMQNHPDMVKLKEDLKAAIEKGE